MLRLWLKAITQVGVLTAGLTLAAILIPQTRPAIVLEYNELRFYQRVFFIHYIDIEHRLTADEQMPFNKVVLQGSETKPDRSRMSSISFENIGTVIETSDTAPDGRRLVTLPTPGNMDVFLVTPGAEKRQLTHFSDFPPRQVGRDPRRANSYAIWSPDAAWIVFLSSDEVGHIDLYAMRPDGSDLRRLAYHINNEGPVEPQWVRLKTE